MAVTKFEVLQELYYIYQFYNISGICNIHIINSISLALEFTFVCSFYIDDNRISG